MKGHSLEVQNHCSLKSYTVEMKYILVLTNSAKISKLIIQFCNGGTFWEFQFIASLEESIHIFILLYCDYNQRRRIV